MPAPKMPSLPLNDIPPAEKMLNLGDSGLQIHWPNKKKNPVNAKQLLFIGGFASPFCFHMCGVYGETVLETATREPKLGILSLI